MQKYEKLTIPWKKLYTSFSLLRRVSELAENGGGRGLLKIFIATGIVVCFALICTIVALNMPEKNPYELAVVSDEDSDGEWLVFSEKDFLLEANVSKTVFNVGEKIFINATLTNISGRAVTVEPMGYYMPCVYVYDNAKYPHLLFLPRYWRFLEPNDKMVHDWPFEFEEIGTYVFGVHYDIEVNGIRISDELDDIIVEVK